MGFVYKGYLLKSKPTHLAETNRWTMEATIAIHGAADGETKEQTFSTGNTFATKELAAIESIIFARKIIDGEIPGLSFDEPR